MGTELENSLNQFLNETMQTIMPKSRDRSMWMPGVLLALMPIGSFLLQYALSVQADTQAFLFQHFTVTIVDWIFVPFNIFVVHAIDWRRGGSIFGITILSVVLNTAAHAYWQFHFVTGGHMISQEHVVLPAGWVHLVFSTCQMILLAAFIFVRRSPARFVSITTLIAVCYFVSAGLCGYIMNDGFLISDVLMVFLGLIFLVAYPAVVRRLSRSVDCSHG